jgi:hypothetical protein
MASQRWATKPLSVASLHLDRRNPRLGRETSARAPREIIQYLFQHDGAFEVAESIATLGYFPNEPLLAIKENGAYVVIEGNRRLAALKALKEPGLLEGSIVAKLERFARNIRDPSDLVTVPVTIAPNRRATDRLLAGRHSGTAVRAWRAENRASFILDKLEEDYTNKELEAELNFTSADIQAARQTRAIAEMARSLDLPEDVKAKVENPSARVYSTLERVFRSTVGREFFKVEPDPEHGLRGRTTKAEFTRALSRLVTDVALNRESSRSLNSNEDLTRYFANFAPNETPSSKKGASFLPNEIIKGTSVASPTKPPPSPAPRSRRESTTVLPKDLKVRVHNPRLIDIRRELTELRRDRYPNAGAVMLRVFLELSILDYLTRINALDPLVERLEKKEALRFGVPTLRQMSVEVVKIAKKKLSRGDAVKVENALRHDESAPFTVSDLNRFVHSDDIPSERDIYVFARRVEPLLRLMLEIEHEALKQ